MMHKAFEYESRFDKNGRPERRWSVGPVLIWGIVALVLGLAGKAFVLPSVIPQFAAMTGRSSVRATRTVL
jgi:hypothetical protein